MFPRQPLVDVDGCGIFCLVIVGSLIVALVLDWFGYIDLSKQLHVPNTVKQNLSIRQNVIKFFGSAHINMRNNVGKKDKAEPNGLEIIKSLKFCGCGDPDAGYSGLRDFLAIFDAGDRSEAAWKAKCDRVTEWFKKLGDPTAYLLLYFFTETDLIEHGGSVGGSWLTEKGQLALEFLRDCGTDPDEW
jgi:hypothetical protein